MRIIFSLLLLLLLMNPAYSENLTVEMENVNLTDALRLVAKFLQLSLIISPAVTGTVTLHLHDTPPDKAFNLLLRTQGLAKLAMGQAWYIAPEAELIKRQQEELGLQEALTDSAPLVTRVWQIRYADAADIAHFIQDNGYSLLSKRGHVRFDARTNSVCVQDVPDKLTQMIALVKKLDVPVQQVVIKARLVSIDSDMEKELGVNFSIVPQTGDTKRFSLAVAKLADGALLDATLSAMEREGRGELISSPCLFTANQQTASIESGEEIPYQEISLSGGTGTAFKKAVLSLKVTPHVMPGKRVLLQLQVNQDRPSNRVVLGVPAITTRQITTQVLIKNGQTLVLGGIYEVNKEQVEQRIPFLGKIPLVGWLFRQQNAKENKRELLIFVTPNIEAKS